MVTDKILEQWKSIMEESNSTLNPFNPFDMMKMAFADPEDKKKLFDNYMKYHEAFIAYHQSIKDMAETMNDSMEIIKKIKKGK